MPATRSQCPPMATFSRTQRLQVSAFMLQHPEWDIEFDFLTSEDVDPGVVPSQFLMINLPSYFSEGLSGLHGWTLYPTLSDDLVAVVFGEGSPVVVTLSEALEDIGKLAVYEATEADGEEAVRCCPLFMRNADSAAILAGAHRAA